MPLVYILGPRIHAKMADAVLLSLEPRATSLIRAGLSSQPPSFVSNQECSLRLNPFQYPSRVHPNDGSPNLCPSPPKSVTVPQHIHISNNISSDILAIQPPAPIHFHPPTSLSNTGTGGIASPTSAIPPPPEQSKRKEEEKTHQTPNTPHKPYAHTVSPCSPSSPDTSPPCSPPPPSPPARTGSTPTAVRAPRTGTRARSRRWWDHR